jgi:hypothetical protein
MVQLLQLLHTAAVFDPASQLRRMLHNNQLPWLLALLLLLLLATRLLLHSLLLLLLLLLRLPLRLLLRRQLLLYLLCLSLLLLWLLHWLLRHRLHWLHRQLHCIPLLLPSWPWPGPMQLLLLLLLLLPLSLLLHGLCQLLLLRPLHVHVLLLQVMLLKVLLQHLQVLQLLLHCPMLWRTTLQVLQQSGCSCCLWVELLLQLVAMHLIVTYVFTTLLHNSCCSRLAKAQLAAVAATLLHAAGRWL